MKRLSLSLRLLTFVCLLMVCCIISAASLRRPISPTQPAWIIHIDVWNYADPQKIIDMVPEDVRPYVIFNIATSSSDDKSADGPAVYDSWMKVCAQNRVWTMIQCASGSANRMPDTPDNVSAYEQYFKDYPNFLGFNFAEQYWGFDTDGGMSFDTRLNLFASLLNLCNTYGGYLAVSFADSYYNANKMPIAYMKRNSAINTFLSSSPEHFLCFEKYTQKKNFLFNESQCLGAWLSGFTGQYGIRFDSSGWITANDKPDSKDGDDKYTTGAVDFVRAAGAIPVVEHMMLTGQTMMDGPELSWTECSMEGSTTTVDGYTQRNWEWYQQFTNISLDLFRKVLDGTIRIMSKEEVLARTKVCVVSGDDYLTPVSLFDGLYRNENDKGGLKGLDDNHWLNNRWWMKSTGRYPTIPTMMGAGTLTDIGSYTDVTAKQDYLNTLFNQEYTGDIYAGRHENGWVTYNPYQYDDVTSDAGVRTLGKATKRAKGTIPFKYNTCESVDMEYAPYSLGIMKEYNNKVTFYLQNYEGGTDVIKINGATSEPTYTASSGSVTKTWVDGVLTLSITHSGAAVELTINCSGSATGRNTSYTTASVTVPAAPEAYTGVLQYEAELADYKSATIHKSGYGKGHDGYKGQGFAELSGSCALRFHVNVPEAGYYMLSLYYQAGAACNMTLSAGSNSYSLQMANADIWSPVKKLIKLPAGAQTIDLTKTDAIAAYIDCIQLDRQDDTPVAVSTEVVPAYIDVADITYTRELSAPTGKGDITIDSQAAQLYTVCLPYTPPTGGGLKYYTLKGVRESSLLFTEVDASEVSANTPYMVAVIGSSNEEIGSGTSSTFVNFNASVSDGTAIDGYRLRGTLRGLTNAEAQGLYILQSGNIWGSVPADNSSIYIPPFRAYITAPAGSRPRLHGDISNNGDPTAVWQIKTLDADGTVRWYDLNGRQTASPKQKGIYIINGKKIIVK